METEVKGNPIPSPAGHMVLFGFRWESPNETVNEKSGAQSLNCRGEYFNNLIEEVSFYASCLSDFEIFYLLLVSTKRQVFNACFMEHCGKSVGHKAGVKVEKN